MTKPTFQQVRKQHDITLNMLIEDAQIDPSGSCCSIRGGSAKRASLIHCSNRSHGSRGRCIVETFSMSEAVRHEVALMSVSATQVAMRPAVSPAVSYQDMRSEQSGGMKLLGQ
jgi:hypothetical protein